MTCIWMVQWFKAMAEERRARPPRSSDVPDDDDRGRRSTEHEDDGTIELFALKWRNRRGEPYQ